MKKMTRNAAIGGLALLVGLPLALRDGRTEAEKFYDSFPSALSGAEKVEKYEAKDAKHCLVHVRQIHNLLEPMSLTETQNLIRKVNAINAEPNKYDAETVNQVKESITNGKFKQIVDEVERMRTETRRGIALCTEVQGNIYAILTDLRTNHSVTSVRNEGAYAERSREECLYEMSSTILELADKGYIAKEEAKVPALYPGAALVVGYRGELRVKAAGTPEIDRGFFECLSAGRGSACEELLFNPREDQVLRLISNEKEPYSTVVFGGEHDFRDNVYERNRNNPEDTFSLIVVTPKKYEENLSILENLDIEPK